MADCLVIGGNGFLGSHVVDSLRRRGHHVAAFDRFGVQPVQFSEEGVDVIPGDFLNAADVRGAVAGRDVVLHFLSTTDPASAEDDPTLDIRTNVLASVELFAACVEAGVGKVYFASTGGAIYGDQERTTFREEDVTVPVSPYSIGKQTIEGYLRYFRRKHGLDSTSFRISNPYGPRQNPAKRQGVIPIFLRNVALGRPLRVYGDGSMIRDYLYVEDMAEMVAHAVSDGTQHELYNLGSGLGTSLREVVRLVTSVTGRQPLVETTPVPSTFVDHVVLDTSRFAAEFGTRPLTSLEDGMRRTWAEIAGDSA
ncbi:NAD-dependent epimerase/dehydratase family protein [Actinotalea sp. Marseille-Q4924]|uniref:NAD-dependent epimerase/dehydratase family protein n=1 Tax=Actinotalea sp. Marseille-Q4924 TaxID=2866571 RepID=UPI001CE3E953|nr:NAD-dependent epimerase/dehydratase family protein [Actinotalea sp. Marseille-Q4924]